MFTKIGDDLLPTQVYHPAKFHRPASTPAGDVRYKNLQTNKETKKETVNDVSQHAYRHVWITIQYGRSKIQYDAIQHNAIHNNIPVIQYIKIHYS